jgi:hypothetical protein
MAERFSDLRKIPRQPAARLLAAANTKLSAKIAAPAAAPVETVLTELAERDERIDMLRLLAAALPAREAIWWGCLAARDTLPEGGPVPPPLAATEAWVFKPGDETRAAAAATVEAAEPDDDTTLLARAVAMHDGKLGVGNMQAYDAPPGAVSAFVFGMIAVAIGAKTDRAEPYMETLADRALDIARGGDGRLPVPPAPPDPQAEARAAVQREAEQ